MAQKRRKTGSYITGEKGTNRVRLFSQARDGKLYLEFRDEAKRKRSVCLDHDDFSRGKAQADELALKLRQNEVPSVGGVLTLKGLFDRYEREVTGTKAPAKQAHDRRTRVLFEECWGSSVKVSDLDRRDWDRFIQQRRSGALRPSGARTIGVRNRVIEYDLQYLVAVCNWALDVREHGKPLLERNPFAGFPRPKEENPDRPVVTPEEMTALENAAPSIGPEVALYLLMVKETGHRCTAVARLRWSDVDLTKGLARWRAEHDKLRREHVVALSEVARVALTKTLKDAARIGDGWIFPSPLDPSKPIRRDLLRDWWQKLEKASGIERVRGRGWHSLRRLFATDLQHNTPLKVLCELGGWRDPNTILKCYAKADEASMRAALDKRASLRAVGQ